MKRCYYFSIWSIMMKFMNKTQIHNLNLFWTFIYNTIPNMYLIRYVLRQVIDLLICTVLFQAIQTWNCLSKSKRYSSKPITSSQFTRHTRHQTYTGSILKYMKHHYFSVLCFWIECKLFTIVKTLSFYYILSFTTKRTILPFLI